MLKILSLKPRPHTDKGESGNVFLFILIGVVLFAALGYSVAKGFRSDTSSTLTKKQIDLAADDILTYAQKISRTVDRLRRNGCSESEISFENPVISGYEFVTRDECKVFDTAGGGLTYRAPVADWLETDSTITGYSGYGEINISGRTCRENETNCHLDGIDNEDLILFVPYITQGICKKINTRLNITDIPTDVGCSGAGLTSSKFKGQFSAQLGLYHADLVGKGAGCFHNTIGCNWQPNTYHYFHTLIER